MASSPYNTYTLKKGETLAQVAKAHKLQVDEIWKFKLNAKLVSQRKKPDKCTSGDVVQLPLSKAEKQEALFKVEGVLKAMKGRSGDLAAALKKLDSLQADIDAKHKKWSSEIDKLEGNVKGQGDVADAVGIVVSFSVSMASMAKTALADGAKVLVGSSAEIEAQLAKMQRATLASTAENLYGPLSPMGAGVTTVLAQGKDSSRIFVDAVGTAADFFGKLTSPSGWAKFFTGVDKDLEKAREQIDDQWKEMHAQFRSRRNALQAELKSTDHTLDLLDGAYKNMKKG